MTIPTKPLIARSITITAIAFKQHATHARQYNVRLRSCANAELERLKSLLGDEYDKVRDIGECLDDHECRDEILADLHNVSASPAP